MKSSSKTQTSRATRKTTAQAEPTKRGIWKADEIFAAFLVARNSAEKLAARCLVFDADEETLAELHSASNMLIGSIWARHRLQGR